MSRLLTLLLLYRADISVGKYISIEKIIEQSKETYYESLRESSQGWHNNENSYLPFVRFTLGVILRAYNDFDNRINKPLKEKPSVGDIPKQTTDTLKEIIGLAMSVPDYVKRRSGGEFTLADFFRITVSDTIISLENVTARVADKLTELVNIGVSDDDVAGLTETPVQYIRAFQRIYG